MSRWQTTYVKSLLKQLHEAMKFKRGNKIIERIKKQIRKETQTNP